MTIQRRYDLDWLRISSVFAVFLHHVLMPFNGDKFHIMNSESSKLLDNIMVYFEQFRLPLLFLVSGVGTVYAFSKRHWLTFIKERGKRLLVPYCFGILVIIPPQVYYEYIQHFSSFANAYIFIITKFEVNHLWFIGDLFLISIVVIPLVLFIRSNRSAVLRAAIEVYTQKFGMMSWVVVLILIRVVSKDYFTSDSKAFTNLSSTVYYSFFFVSGILIAKNKALWKILYVKKQQSLLLVFVFSVLFYTYYFIPGEYIAPYLSFKNRWRLWYFVCCLVSWSVIVTVLGYCQVLLNKDNQLLRRLNEAVYPFYILHQTVIVVLGYYILKLEGTIFIKALLLFCSSFVVIMAIYYVLIYPFKMMRFLFGMKR